MVSAHRLHRELYSGGKRFTDPGDAKTIRVSQDIQICEMLTGATGETRTLANPTKPGISFTLRLLTDGGGDAVVTASNGLNVDLKTVATFADAGDQLEMISVTKSAGVYRWEILNNTGSVALA